MKKNAFVDLEKCSPGKCSPQDGICPATAACSHKILEQEEPFEAPMIISQTMCTGCGDCVNECPFGAVRILSGSGN